MLRRIGGGASRRGGKATGLPEMKAWYSVGDLSRLSGISRWTILRMLRPRGLLKRSPGSTHWRLWLEDLRLADPRLWWKLVKRREGVPSDDWDE
jgi:hypothetical protein